MPLTYQAPEGDLAAAIRRKRLGVDSQPDAFAPIKPVGDFLGGIKDAVGNGLAAAHSLPVVGGATDLLGTVGDATVKTPIGLAELGADQFLHTGLSDAANRANAGRPFWELPKTAADLTRGALGAISSDTSQSPFARGLAGVAGTTEDIGSLVAPIPGAGELAGIAGRTAEHLPGALERTIGEVSPGAGMFGSREATAVSAGRRVRKVTGEVITPTTDSSLSDALAASLKRLGRPDLIEGDVKPPSDFVKASPRLSSVHDANEAAIAAMKQFAETGAPEHAQAVQDALQNVKDLGGSLDHTASRLREAGLPAPTRGEIDAIKRRPATTDAALRGEVFRSRASVEPVPPVENLAQRIGATQSETIAPKIGATTDKQTAFADQLKADVAVRRPAAPPSNVIPFDLAAERIKNKATLDMLRQRIVESRTPVESPPPPTPPSAPPPSAVVPPTPSVPASALDHFLSIWNLPKALKASLDLSAPFRQGVLLAPGHPGEFARAFGPMFHALYDSKFARDLDATIRSVDRPGLYLAPLDSAKLGAREEAFMSSLADKISGVSASNRAYVTFLNKLRADVYDNVLEGWGKGGKAVSEADRAGLANVINHFTGRGDLPSSGATATAVLNGMFFSPRFAVSRVQSVGDALGILKSPGSLAAREAAGDLTKFVGAGLTILTLAQLAGYKVGTDPRATDFGKIQIGSTAIDIWGGEQQIARYGAQLITGQKVTATGKNAGEAQTAPRGDTLQRFIRSKLAPTTGAVNDVLGLVGGGGTTKKDQTANAGKSFGDQVIGHDFVGGDVTPSSLPLSLTAPLGWQDTLQAAQEGSPLGALSLLGIGVQNTGGSTTSAPATPHPTGAPFQLRPPTNTTAAPTGAFQLRPPARPNVSPVAPLRLTPPSGPKPGAPDFAPNLDGGGDVRSVIGSVAASQGIDPTLALATAYVESGFNPNAVGDNGDSHGLFQENVHGRGSGRAPDYDVARQTQRFAADVRRLLATGYTGSPGEIAAAAQRPANPQHYAQLVDAAYQRLRS